MTETKIGYRLSTGREFYAGESTLSVSPGDDRIFYGYDGFTHTKAVHEFDHVDGGDWTAEERAEVADHMIAVWQAWKEAGK